MLIPTHLHGLPAVQWRAIYGEGLSRPKTLPDLMKAFTDGILTDTGLIHSYSVEGDSCKYSGTDQWACSQAC